MDYILIIEPWTECDYPVSFHNGLWWIVDEYGEETVPVTLH